MTTAEVRTDRVEATVIGFLADTHCQQPDGSDLPDVTLEAFKRRGAGLIVHVGHYGHPGLLNRLSEVAPVMAVTTTLDDRSIGGLPADQAERIGGYARVIEAGGVRIGVVFDLSGNGFGTKEDDPPLALNGRRLPDVLAEKFGAPVDVVAYANQHIDYVWHSQGVLMFNPGSPNLPGGSRKGGLGTVAVLSVKDGLARLEIVDLEREKQSAEAVGA
jgi:putative phosphoesterase